MNKPGFLNTALTTWIAASAFRQGCAEAAARAARDREIDEAVAESGSAFKEAIAGLRAERQSLHEFMASLTKD